MRSHYNADDGEELFVYVAGEGPPMVMLHGWTASHQEWSAVLHALSARHTVYRWDARGHGGHRLTRDTPVTVERMARDLENLLEHYRLEDVTAVGHSMGALTLWEYLRRHGSRRIARLCIIDQSPKLVTDQDWRLGIYGDFDSERSRRFLEELRQDFAEAVLRLSAYGLNPRARQLYEQNTRGWQKSREILRALPPAPLIRCWQSLCDADYRDVLDNIDVPVLLIFGAESNFYGLDVPNFLLQRLAQANLRVYEGSDHSPHRWHRDRFAADLLEFATIANRVER